MDAKIEYEITIEGNGAAESLADKLARYRDMRWELRPALDALTALEKEIKAQVLEAGGAPVVDGTQVMVRSGYERDYWDGRALSGYALAHPEVLEMRAIRRIGPSVSIRVVGEDQ